MGNPQHIADLALFLASAKSNYITGQTISVDGGLYMS
jgi:NAD(P)-dependent dehydrogenase (short-subunit alcohol dehydrogenase family)